MCKNLLFYYTKRADFFSISYPPAFPFCRILLLYIFSFQLLANGIYDNDGKINNNKTTIGKSSEYKIKVIGSTLNNNNTLAAEVAVPLKYLSKFWRSLNLSLIKCEIEVDLRWTKNCVIPEISRTFRAVGDTLEQEVATSTTGATF